MAKADKKEISIDLHDIISKYDFEGSLEEVQKKLSEVPLRVLSKPGLTSCHRFAIRTEHEWDYDNSYTLEYVLECYRWETDKEFKDRIAKEKGAADSRKKRAQRMRLAKEKREKTMYENLKKKFGKS